MRQQRERFLFGFHFFCSITVHRTPWDSNRQTRVFDPFSTTVVGSSLLWPRLLLRCLTGSSTFSILNAPWMKPRSITRNTIPRLFIVVCRTVRYLSSSYFLQFFLPRDRLLVLLLLTSSCVYASSISPVPFRFRLAIRTGKPFSVHCPSSNKPSSSQFRISIEISGSRDLANSVDVTSRSLVALK